MGKNIVKWCMLCIAVIVIPCVLTVLISGAPIDKESRAGAVSADSSRTDNTSSYSLEEYLMTAMAANTSSEFEMETLKAQAVILRTMVYERLNELDAQGANEQLSIEELGIPTMSMDELKSSYEEEEYTTFVSNIENAVYSTRGQILTYEGKPIKAYFHYANTGKTRSYEEVFGEKIPYLSSVDSAWDVEATVAVHSSEFELSYATDLLKENYQISTLTKEDFFNQVSISVRDEAGYVKELKVGEATLSGEEFADAFALNSTNFYMDNYDGKLIIVCKGKGNGLGFSQYGANCMAKEGESYDSLLFYYYTDAVLSVVES